ncbi:MAG: HD domain-containing protein [Clostridiales bacterium]|nr:HD domain-containing protein [Clostridiales bacterium]
MIQIFYGGMFVSSLLCTAVYIYVWHKHYDVNFTMIFTLVPVACLGYVLQGLSESLEGLVRAVQVIYIGGCFLQLFILLSIFNLCRIGLPKWLRTALYLVCVCLFFSVLTTGRMDLFYRDISYDASLGTPVLARQYGPMHGAFYAVILLFFAVGIAAIGYSLHRKKQVPRTILYLLILPDVICMLSFFVGRRIIQTVDFVPLGYVLAELTFLLIAHRVNLYDVSDTVIDSMVQDRGIGYVSFDYRYRYLGSNHVAKQLVPGLADLAVDEPFGYKPTQRKIRHFLDSFRQDPENSAFVYTVPGESGDDGDERIYNVNVNYLYDGIHRRGYIVTFTDDTANKKYIRLLDTYNESLQQQVEAKTRHIVEMHDNLIMSLAMMVESRDNSTGGHIKRTSEGVRILIDEIVREGALPLSPEFCRDVVKAAPMHDLGKIAVDDAVLRKPGKFTDEEYAKMKRHAAEGARVIHEILLHTDDRSFKAVAENVAHYHHERWDGSGYPDGLSGEQIPIEARIMAVADVYDALVSRRVYKEAFDFERANRIILEGMGTQFDPGLRSAYEKARPRLEEYYKALPET